MSSKMKLLLSDWGSVQSSSISHNSLDIDRLIRERDLESLQTVLSSIVSCNLTNEYDLKVLDPNFVKLFRLAQLAVDYLQYCRNYLDHCVIVLQEQLQVALHEVEQLQQERNTKDDQIKQLSKKLKSKVKVPLNNGVAINVADSGVAGHSGANSGISSSLFRCLPCGKMFVSAVYLQRHVLRRHPEQLQAANETEDLHLLIRHLQERLQKTEELLQQQAKDALPKVTKEIPASKEDVETVDRQQNTDSQLKIDRAQNTDEELSRRKDVAEEAVKSKHQAESDMRSLLDCLKRQTEEIELLKTQLQSQHVLQESLWQNRMDQLEQRHQTDIESLRSSLSQPNSLTAPVPVKRNFDSKDFQEKQVSHSLPEMLVNGTQVEVIQERTVPHTSQEAATKPSPSQLSSASPVRQSPRNFNDWNQRFNQEIPNPNEKHHQGVMQTEEVMRPATAKKSPGNTDLSRSPKVSLPFPGKATDVVDLSSESPSEGSSEGSEGEREESHLEEVNSETEETSSNSEEDGGMLSSLANKPQILASLREDVHGLMLRSLQDLGVDPEWTGIPSGTYQSIRNTLQHQRTIAPKGHRSLAKLRRDLSREVESKARTIAGSSKREVQERSSTRRKVPARPPPPRSSPKNKPENDYTAEPKRDRSRMTTTVYEEVSEAPKFSTEDTSPPVPPIRKRSPEKEKAASAEGRPTEAKPAVPVPVPPPRVTPTTAELLADVERLRQQGTLLKAEGSVAKSNLKSSLPSGNVAKKRVVFQDEKHDIRTVGLGLSDSEFGMFHPRPADSTSGFANKRRDFSANDIYSDDVNKFESFTREGSGEPGYTVGETNVSRLAREIEMQLQNRPKPPYSGISLLPKSDLHKSELDLILDDLSSS